MFRTMIGDAEVIAVPEMEYRGFNPESIFKEVDADAFAAERHWMDGTFYDPENRIMPISIHAWVIRTGRHTVLVDTCCGDDKERPARPQWHRLKTGWLDRLKAAGVDPAAVDYVMCTHMHVDHVGWNTRLENGRWVPTFPNAKYLFSRIENEAFSSSDNELWRMIYDDSVLPVVEAGQALMVEDGHDVDGAFTVAAAPGHTPGNCTFTLNSGGREGLFVGDVIHHPFQLRYPDWQTKFCLDPVQSSATRRRVLEQAAERQCLFLPAHFLAPHCGHVKPKGDAFTFDWLS